MRDPWEVEDHAQRVLAALFRQIVKTAWPSVLVKFRDAVPRVEVAGSSGVVVDVRVDDDGEEFVFRPSYGRHSTADLPGAVAAVLALVRDSDQPVVIPPGPGADAK